MPPTRHTRRQGRDGAGGFNADTTPFFMRQKSSRLDDVVGRGVDAANLLQSIGNTMNMENLQIVASSCLTLFDTVQTVRSNKEQCIRLLERVHQIVRTMINLCGDANGMMLPAMERAIEQFTGWPTDLSPFCLSPSPVPSILRWDFVFIPLPVLEFEILTPNRALTQIHTFLQAQTSQSLIMRFLRYAETQDQITNCSTALQQALELFTVRAFLSTASHVPLRSYSSVLMYSPHTELRQVQTAIISGSAMGSLRRDAAVRHAEILQRLRR
ncbi:hypothetical protein C8R44DRAFT_980131 [Mycena epipterygia]|nr:hypothetical protein C8R44DRAFT_980131 [Mycena epipterygia]